MDFIKSTGSSECIAPLSQLARVGLGPLPLLGCALRPSELTRLVSLWLSCFCCFVC
jgi:hypothetical protein